jgi:betaine-aldehyde dehydrogenase
MVQLTYQTKLYYDGRFQAARSGATFDVIDPSNEEILARVAAAGEEDVDAAVRAAYRQYSEGDWSRTPGGERSRLLLRLADLMERDKEIIASLESRDNGKLLGMVQGLDVPNAIETFRYFAGWADKLEGRTIPVGDMFGRPVLSYTIREPLGVIGGITAYNAPTMMVAWKAAAALAAGNTFVLKPAEEAPLSSLYIAKLVDEAGFPPGVFNIVSGLGPVAGMALVRHPLVAKISYTGGGAVGRIIAGEAAKTLKPVTLELGGKAPQVVMESADLASTIPMLVMGVVANQGQICAAGTRILVHRSRYKEVVDALAEGAKSQKLGNPADPTVTMGPLSTARSVTRVMGYVEAGKAEGAKLVAGGTRNGGKGYFVQPTIFAGSNDMKIAREEIFGPVGTVIPFDNAEEAIKIANDTEYGLSAAIFTSSTAEANLAARRIRAGAVWINAWGMIAPALPWGGVKASGYGRENGWNGIEDVTHEKVVTTIL